MSGNLYINDNGDGDNYKLKRSSLRSAEANVKVYVGKDLIFDEEPKEFWHYSHILASQSGYIDTLLSTPLSKKNDSFPLNNFIEISIGDIAPSQWKRMINFLENHLNMLAEDAIELSMLYDKYDFEIGKNICDEILFKKALLKSNKLGYYENTIYSTYELDRCVQAIALSNLINLKKTFHWGRLWIFVIFNELKEFGTGSCFPLNANHIMILAPTIIRDSELCVNIGFEDCLDPIDSITYLEKYLNGGGDEFGFGLKNVATFDFGNGTHCDITNPVFPQLLIAMNEKNYAIKVAQIVVKRIVVEFSNVKNYNHKSSGVYMNGGIHDDRVVFNNEHCFRIDYCREKRQWQIGGYGNKNGDEIIFYCRGSQFAPIPPKNGWVAVSDTTIACPTLIY